MPARCEIRDEPGAGAVLASLPALSEPRVRRSTAAQRLHCLFVELFCRTHELECVNNLFAVRMLVNLASGSVGEFVLVMCRNRIAERERVNDPDCAWLHCLPPTRETLIKGAMPTRCQLLPSRGSSTPRKQLTSTGKTTLRTSSSGKRPAWPRRSGAARILRGGETKKWPRCPVGREKQRGAERTNSLIARVAF